ncbi:MAG: hypothetical protein FWC32_05490 [Firmicutes bacterium]|nr:hypothetical protein [Bacillota bacterium]
MYSQMYYHGRNRIGLRLLAFAIVLFGGIFFLFFASRSNSLVELHGSAVQVSSPTWQSTLGIVFASLSLIGIIIVSLYVTDENFKKIFKDPGNYLYALTPVPAWKKITGWLIPSLVLDGISVALGVLSVLILSVTVTMGESLRSYIANEMDFAITWNILYGIIVLVLFYTLLLSAAAFGSAVSNTVLSLVPLRKLCSVVITIATLFGLSWLNAVLLPFGELNRFGFMFNITLYQPTAWHFISIILLLLAQVLALIIAAAYLMDRRA